MSPFLILSVATFAKAATRRLGKNLLLRDYNFEIASFVAFFELHVVCFIRNETS